MTRKVDLLDLGTRASAAWPRALTGGWVSIALAGVLACGSGARTDGGDINGGAGVQDAGATDGSPTTSATPTSTDASNEIGGSDDDGSDDHGNDVGASSGPAGETSGADTPDDTGDGPFVPPAELPPEPEHEGTVEVTATIVIDEPGFYDFGKVLHIWKGPDHNCTGELENGPQILRIEASDVTVKDFYYVGDGESFGSNGLGDPVHVASCGAGQGNLCTEPAPQHVIIDGLFGHACEDLLTIGTPGTDDVLVKNSYLKPTPNQDNWDKTIQINFGTNLRFENNIFAGGARCIRFKPNTTGSVLGNGFYGCNTAVLASSNDADISPMEDGPTTVQYTADNWCMDCADETKAMGDEVTFTE